MNRIKFSVSMVFNEYVRQVYPPYFSSLLSIYFLSFNLEGALSSSLH